MTRRSTRLMRLENSLYSYNADKESWDVREVESQTDFDNENFFELGSYFTCKHMSQKVNPISFRMNKIKTWDSAWYSDYKKTGVQTTKLQKDLYIRDYVQGVFQSLKVFIDKVQVKEHNNKFFVKLYLYEPGISNKRDVVINLNNKKRIKNYLNSSIEKDTINPFYHQKLGSASNNWFINTEKVLEHIENQLTRYLGDSVYLSAQYTKDVSDSASLLSNYLTAELERPNASFKKALKETLSKIKDKKAIRGLRVNCSGRLGRAPMAKMEWFRFGSIPLTKLSAMVDYNYAMGKTKYGSFGVKVWLYKN